MANTRSNSCEDPLFYHPHRKKELEQEAAKEQAAPRKRPLSVGKAPIPPIPSSAKDGLFKRPAPPSQQTFKKPDSPKA